MRTRPDSVRSARTRASSNEALLAAAVLAALAASGPAQLQFDELTRRAMPLVPGPTYAVASGDVDGDGDLDLVLGQYSSGGEQTRLYLNDGIGMFTDATATRMPVGLYGTTSLAMGDVDGDGDLDLIIGNNRNTYVGAQTLLYLNDGTGTFTDATQTHMPASTLRTVSVALGDVDGDGDPDLVLGNVSSNIVFGIQSNLYLNDGTGRFTDVTSSHFPQHLSNAQALAFGDVDGDGDLDLALACSGYPYPWAQSRLFLNDGTGRFTDVTTSKMPRSLKTHWWLELGDVDGDGDLDMVLAATSGRSRLYMNDGSGAFTDETATRLPANSYNTNALALGDVDFDGDLDMVLGNCNYANPQRNALFLNNGRGEFTDETATRMPAGGYCTLALVLGDVDGDGDRDLVAGVNGQSRLNLNDGSGTFTDPSPGRLPVAEHTTRALAFGDMDGDGDPDLVLGNHGSAGSGRGQSRLYLNDGRGSYTDATAIRMPVGQYFTEALAFGDVDGDGDPDLVLGNGYLGQQSRLYLNDGTGTFTDATATHMPVGAHRTTSLELGDVDADGDLDLVLGTYLGQSRLYLNDGTGAFADVTATHMPVGSHRTNSVASGDVDGDGDPDLILGNTSPGLFGGGAQSRLYLNDGTGRFADATATHLPAGNYNTGAVAFGDVDGDGDLDLVLGNGSISAQQSRLYLNEGTGTFFDATVTHMPVRSKRTRSLELGDVDGDGDLDLVLGQLFGQGSLYFNDGSGRFADATATRLPAGSFGAYALVLGDVDRDGDLDLVVGNDAGQRGGQSVLYLNLLRQLDAPSPLVVGRTYRLNVYSRHGSTGGHSDVAALFLSTASANIPLPPFGVFGIDPSQMLSVPPFAILQPEGLASFSFPMPNLPALAGTPIYSQAAVLRSPALVRLSNVNVDVIQ